MVCWQFPATKQKQNCKALMAPQDVVCWQFPATKQKQNCKALMAPKDVVCWQLPATEPKRNCKGDGLVGKTKRMVPDSVGVVQKFEYCTKLTPPDVCLVSMTTWWAAGRSLSRESNIRLGPESLALFIKRHKWRCNKVSKSWWAPKSNCALWHCLSSAWHD